LQEKKYDRPDYCSDLYWRDNPAITFWIAQVATGMLYPQEPVMLIWWQIKLINLSGWV